jgi:hypothetical protein
MSYTSNYNLNIRLSNIESLLKSLGPIPPGYLYDLNSVLGVGNSAGTFDIDMNNNDILDVNNIDVVTINGSVYPPVVEDLQATLTAGNDSNLSILLKDNLITPTELNTIGSSSLSITGTGSVGSVGFAVGDVNVNGTATGIISGTVASATTLSLINSAVSTPPLFQPANTTATLTSGTTSASLGFTSGGQFINAKAMNLTLDGITHTSSTGGDFTINTTDNLILTSDTLNATATNLSMSSSAVGNIANPILTLTNTNATGSVAMECYKNKPTPSVNGDVLFTQSVFGKDSGNAKQEYTRINHTVRDVTAGVEDGSIEFGCFVNGAINTFIQINGNENEVNILRTLDMASNPIRSSTGTLNINSNILMDNSERIAISNPAGTIFNIAEQFQVDIQNITAPTNTFQNLNNTTSHQLRNVQSSVSRAYTNISDATSTIITETDTSGSVDVKTATLTTNLITMNDFNGGTTEEVDITPTYIQFTSSGSASDTLSMYNDSADGGEIEWSNSSGTNGLKISSSHSLTLESTTGLFFLTNLPTSIGGLPTGALWNNGGVLSIV